MSHSPSVFAHGKICYLEIPALDIHQSAAFYRDVFGWHVREDQQGNVSFDDPVGQVSGTWVQHRSAAPTPGVVISIMVDSVTATLRQVEAQGSRVTQSPDAAGGSGVVAYFADPAGNVFCLYQNG